MERHTLENAEPGFQSHGHYQTQERGKKLLQAPVYSSIKGIDGLHCADE